jgi:Ca2+-binding EF-hand superfamily protein
MSWHTPIALAALVLSPVVSAQAPEASRPGDRPHAPEQALLRADTSGDGKVSFDELRAQRPNVTQEMFNRMDTNGDGFLTSADRGTVQRGARGGQPGQDGGEARLRMMDRLLEADANGDGRVTFEELSASRPGFAKSDFDRFDRNADGVISREDMPRAPREGDRPRPPRRPDGEPATRSGGDARVEFRQRLDEADSDGDGLVSFAEAQKAFPQMTRERFDALDRDGDGKIGAGDRPQGANPRTNPSTP